MSQLVKNIFFDRDLSWLSFNARVLEEAGRKTVPLMERLKFLSIYSSNLDEFYRVRMPALMALDRMGAKGKKIPANNILRKVNAVIHKQLRQFGSVISKIILPELSQHHITLLFNQTFPKTVRKEAEDLFFQEVAGFLHVVELTDDVDFFPENNKLYLIVTLRSKEGIEKHFLLNIPSDRLPRFYSISHNNSPHIIFLDDIIKLNISKIFREYQLISSYSFKVTRDAELDLKDEFEGNLAKKIEHEISRRDFGLATRFLFDSRIPADTLELLSQRLGLQRATFVRGGAYHNLKDLASLPLKDNRFSYDRWPVQKFKIKPGGKLLFDLMRRKEMLLHAPFHAYDTVIRFFNEAAIDSHVTRIYISLYRVASDSRIANALIHASRNGKKVMVFVELKARFDEANNIKWAKKMKEAGVNIIFSIPELKVHAKVALVKRKKNRKTEYYGLLSTGNFNESTARFYTDHILMTTNASMLREAEDLFRFLKKRRKPTSSTLIPFHHLLVAQFNLQDRFMEMIDREIDFASKGLPAAIVIKMNNLEDKAMISKLYDASRAGVKISMIVRSICCLVPGVKGMSENISVIRIVDRYLEHGRIFVFNNNGEEEVFLGSADWMNRNMHRRIEVCFPIYDLQKKAEIMRLLACQLKDSIQAVNLDDKLNNVPVVADDGTEGIQSQKAICKILAGQ